MNEEGLNIVGTDGALILTFIVCIAVIAGMTLKDMVDGLGDYIGRKLCPRANVVHNMRKHLMAMKEDELIKLHETYDWPYPGSNPNGEEAVSKTAAR